MDFKKENKVKNTLKAREIQPSEEVWGKLEKELNQSYKKRNFRVYKMIIAAVMMISFLIGGLFYFNTSEKNTEELSIDEVNIKSKKTKPVEKSVVYSEETKKTEKNISSINKEKSEKSNQDEIAAENISKKVEKNISNDKELIVRELNESVDFLTKAKTRNNKKEKTLSAEQEAEMLLAEALKSVENSKISTKVDAENLLTEIDKELSENSPEESQKDFKKQMQNILKEGFDKAKSALAHNK